MIKWIGQHIVDFVARFRSDVYLEDISTGTIASGGNLGLDSNNKIVKANEDGATLTQEQVEDYAGALVATGGTKTGISVTYQDGTGDMDFVVDHDTATNFAANEHYTQANIVATGALNSGSITSGFGNIDNGSSTLDTGALTATTITVPSRVYALPGTSDGDHLAGDVVYFGGTTSMTAGYCYYFTGGGAWALANASTSEATASGLLAIALGDESDVDGMLLRGMVTPYGPAGTDDHGKKVYLRAQDGILTTDIPTTSGHFVRIVGYMLHASNDAIYFNPDNTWVEIA